MQPLFPLPATPAEALALLKQTITGAVLAPADGKYSGLQPRVGEQAARPAAIVMACTAGDVVEALRTARAAGLPVAVRSTGHRSGSPADGALLVDVSALDGVAVDPAAGTATVAAGATWARVVAETVPHGLAPVPGEWAHRSAVSDTLAGGMGWLARRHGLACDNVVRYDLVTPDGLLVDVSPDSHPEVFWALSGAGDGSLGVVTAIEIELHPIRPAYAGALSYPVRLAAEVAEHWRAWTVNARPELTASLMISADAVEVRGCWAGAPDTGRDLVDDWRSWCQPDADDWRHRAPGDLDTVNPAWLTPGAPATRAMTNDWANTLRDELVAAVLGLVAEGAVGCVEIRLGGGAARVRSGAAANGHARRDQFLVTLADISGDQAAVRARLAPWVTGAAYLDRCDPAERAARVDDAFAPADRARLAAVKSALDPTGRFRHGLAIAATPIA